MLTLEKLSLSYGDKKKILNDITLNIGDGECILFTGKSGSGKSSIINSINGLAFEYENASISGACTAAAEAFKLPALYVGQGSDNGVYIARSRLQHIAQMAEGHLVRDRFGHAFFYL